MELPHPNYDHIHAVEALPRRHRSDSHIVTHGYATGMSGRVPQTWVFFDHLEPAAVFGRAGRMGSPDITGYGVYEAAAEVRYHPGLDRDIHTLHVNLHREIRDHGSERRLFERWIRGTSPASAHFQPPGAR
jgi:hypothetical protein